MTFNYRQIATNTYLVLQVLNDLCSFNHRGNIHQKKMAGNVQTRQTGTVSCESFDVANRNSRIRKRAHLSHESAL